MKSIVIVLCCSVFGVQSQLRPEQNVDGPPYEVTSCVLTIYETSTGSFDDGETFQSTGRWRIAEVPFRGCDNTALVPSRVSSTEGTCQTDREIANLIDQDKTTDYRCEPDGDEDVTTVITFAFDDPVIVGGYDIISKSSNSGNRQDYDYPTKFTMECKQGSAVVLSDKTYETNAFAPVTNTNELEKRYSSFETTNPEDKFSGSFDEEISQCPDAVDRNNDSGFEGIRESNVGGDPFVMVDGEAIQFWLPVGVWTEVLSSPKLKVLCRSFGRPGTTEQWLDGLRIVDVSGDVYTGKDLLQVEIPRDIPLGSLAANADSDLSFLRIFIDDAPVEHTSRDQLSSMNNLVSVHVGKLSKTIMGLSGDGLWVHTPDFGFSIFTSAAAKFDTATDNDAFAHINFKFTDLPRDHDLAGFFVETIHGTDMSDTTKDMLLRPQSPYAMDKDLI